eukprot:m51a1_g4085 putative rrna methyltransferase (914) ;mRNA; f:34122-38317
MPAPLPALALACIVALGAVAQVDECMGPGSEHYDLADDPHSEITGLVVSLDHTPTQPLCEDSGTYSLQSAQLFTPPQIPWKFTRVCFALGLIDSPYRNKSRPFSLEVHGQVSLYPVTVSPLTASLKPGDRLSYSGFSKTVRYTPSSGVKGNVSRIQYQWFSVDLSDLSTPLVAWDQGAYVGLQFMSCYAPVLLVGVKRTDGKGRLNMMINGGWRPLDGVDAVAIRTVGHNYSGVPPAWSCDPKLYNDGACDCECGTGDIDCSRNFNVAYGCDVGQYCDQSGRCVANYWHYDGCQCECGAVPDPDCFDPYAKLDVCGGNLTQPICLFNGDRGYTFCDDCNNLRLNTTCKDNFVCINDKCAAPRQWTCSVSWFNAHDGCDCKCGAYDPDCDESQTAYHCGTGEVCDYNGLCVAPGCGNHRAEGLGNPKEECDSGVGCTLCKCDAGYYAKSPLRQDCETRCGNGVVDAERNENCDGGNGCDKITCLCSDGYTAFSPPQKYCRANPVESNRKKVIIGSAVGSAAGVLLITAVVAALLYARKVKNGPRKLNLPLEMNTPPAFSVVDSIASIDAALDGASMNFTRSSSDSVGNVVMAQSFDTCPHSARPRQSAELQPGALHVEGLSAEAEGPKQSDSGSADMTQVIPSTDLQSSHMDLPAPSSGGALVRFHTTGQKARNGRCVPCPWTTDHHAASGVDLAAFAAEYYDTGAQGYVGLEAESLCCAPEPTCRLDVRLRPAAGEAPGAPAGSQLAAVSRPTAKRDCEVNSWFAIGILRPKSEPNHGTLWRSAYQLGASFCFSVGARYSKKTEHEADTAKVWAQLPFHQYGTWMDFVQSAPYSAEWVAVEIGGEPLRTFVHPRRAIYILGAEDTGLPPAVLQSCHKRVCIETARMESFNVAIAGSIIMYDRLAKDLASQEQK